MAAPLGSTMVNPVTSIESYHEDMVHDCQFDYYSKKLATCSSDRTIKIFEVNGDLYTCTTTLKVHDGPVWQVAWAHPKFGPLLASCGYDGLIVIHREVSTNNWTKVYETSVPEASVNSISWAPHEFGLILAAASSDGKVTIIELDQGTWSVSSFQNDNHGCNSVSWAPYNTISSHNESGAHVLRLVTGSCDSLVRVWHKTVGTNEPWTEEKLVDNNIRHNDWVRDVAFAPNSSLPYSIFASCSEDGKVLIWQYQTKSNSWEPKLINEFNSPVWRLSWSVTGSILAISTGDHVVTLWKQSVNDNWVQVSNISETD